MLEQIYEMLTGKLMCVALAVFLTVSGPLSSKGRSAPSNSLDFSGMDQFWGMVDQFQKNNEPTEAQWKALFATPGYAYLVNVEGQGGVFMRCFPLAFMPSKEAELNAALSSGTNDVRYLKHYLAVKAHRRELIDFESQLKTKDLLSPALLLTKQYLPRGVIERYPKPVVSFAIFEPDGRAGEGTIVIDLLNAMAVDLVPYIGHESHHYYLDKISAMKPLDHGRDDFLLVKAINQLRTEGIADLIDKSRILDPASSIGKDPTKQSYDDRYRKIYGQSADIFGRMDQLISQISDDPSRVKENSKMIWNLLPFGCHPNGYYMARTIVDQLGKESMVAEIANPFAFFRQYNKAAEKAVKAKGGNYHVFSDKSMKFLDGLEKQCLVNRQS